MFLTKLSLFAGRFLADTETNEAADQLVDSIYKLLFTGWVRGLVLGGVALFAIIRGVMIGMAIVKAADDEGEKSKQIKGLKTLIIGVAIVLVLYFAAGLIFRLISGGLGSATND